MTNANQDVVDEILRLCGLVKKVVLREQRAISSDQWNRMDALLNRKGQLLQQIQGLGLGHLDKAKLSDVKAQVVEATVKEIMEIEESNQMTLKAKMALVQNRLGQLKNSMRAAAYLKV